MKKLLCAALSLALLLSLLWGCDDYSESRAEEQADNGRHMMEAFLQEHLPLAVVVHSEAVEEFVAGGRHTLTEYVKGTYRESANSDVIREFWVNTGTGEIYLSEHYEELVDLLRQELPKLWRLGPEVRVSSLETAPFVLPHTASDPNAWESSWEANVLPFGTDVRAYLENWQDRDSICISGCTVTVPEETDLAGYGLELFRTLPAGVELESAVIENGRQRITVTPLLCARWELEEREDCVLRYVAEYLHEIPDETAEHRQFAPPGSVLEKTAGGYRFSAENDDLCCEIELCAREGMELAEYKYTLRRPDYSDVQLEWKQENGLWVLHGDSSMGRKAVRFSGRYDGAELIASGPRYEH